jgi:hypothetical protein
MFLHLDKNNNVVSFAIIHKCDFDPYKTHKIPYVLDYIYTYKQYRNMGYAQSLINKTKQDYEFTAFCCSNLSYTVFEKCGVNMIDTRNGLIIVRTREYLSR